MLKKKKLHQERKLNIKSKEHVVVKESIFWFYYFSTIYNRIYLAHLNDVKI